MSVADQARIADAVARCPRLLRRCTVDGLLRPAQPGARSVVLGGRERRTGTPVVVKVSGPFDDPDAAARRLEGEARLQAAAAAVDAAVPLLAGPWLVDVPGPDGGGRRHPFVVAERAPAVLKDVRGDLLARPARLLAVVADLLRAVDRLHRLGIGHGDLHPGNCALAADGAPRLLDFADAIRGGRAPAAAQLPPNRGFAPFDSYCGPGLAGCWRRTDAYALGGVACWLLTGRALTDLYVDRALCVDLARLFASSDLPPDRRRATFAKILRSFDRRPVAEVVGGHAHPTLRPLLAALQPLWSGLCALDPRERLTDLAAVAAGVDEAAAGFLRGCISRPRPGVW